MPSTTNAAPRSSDTLPTSPPPATRQQLDRLRKLSAECGHPLEPAEDLAFGDADELIKLFGRLWNEQHHKGRAR